MYEKKLGKDVKKVIFLWIGRDEDYYQNVINVTDTF